MAITRVYLLVPLIPPTALLAFRLLVVYYARARSFAVLFCLPTCIVGLLSIGVVITGFSLLTVSCCHTLYLLVRPLQLQVALM